MHTENNQIDNKKKIRIRTIKDALTIIKEFDKDTAVTYNFIRKLCDNKEIGYMKSGRKILINFDELLNCLDKGGI